LEKTYELGDKTSPETVIVDFFLGIIILSESLKTIFISKFLSFITVKSKLVTTRPKGLASFNCSTILPINLIARSGELT
jgi:hypothetical protein